MSFLFPPLGLNLLSGKLWEVISLYGARPILVKVRAPW